MTREERGELNSFWTRRTWLTRQTLTVAAFAVRSSWHVVWRSPQRCGRSSGAATGVAELTAQAETIDPVPWQALAQQAMDAARTAGAHYADVRLTRVVSHRYICGDANLLSQDMELLGVGVRALVNGYWGFSASTELTLDAVVRVARDAVVQAKENAKGPSREVDLGTIPVARGTWVTPIRIDPFAVPLEEKIDYLDFWTRCGARVGFHRQMFQGWIAMVRQERMVATSEGALFLQTMYESGGQIQYPRYSQRVNGDVTVYAHGLDVAAKGWELFLDAQIPDQMPQLRHEWDELDTPIVGTYPVPVGRYTVVCDGATMAALVEATLGVATQLDRALGYEANASGTSFLHDPLAMLGHARITAPAVTLTANRSAPAALATVHWDDDGVMPEPFTLIQDGVLVDFQTTREQAAWLASYYLKTHRSVRSHGCAASQSAHLIPLQHMPNVALAPSPTALRLEDLIADVADGVVLDGGSASSDFQARTGLLQGRMREIKNGRVGRYLEGGAVVFDAPQLWQNIVAVGGPPTQMERGWSQYDEVHGEARPKGQPPQRTSHSVRAAAATITNLAVIDPSRKA